MLFGTLHQAHADMEIINKIGVQALTALYPISRYIGPRYIGSTVYTYTYIGIGIFISVYIHTDIV
jgi:hypothetical protein